MSRYENIFTDSIKDVIGNEPVLDQFDNYYAASFYRSFQDDYVTGSLLSYELIGGTKKLTIGKRGKAFSKSYAAFQPPLDSTFGSETVSRNPSLAFRQQPWSEKVSTTFFRNVQCFDESERYYDSCIPDLRECFAVNGSRIWSVASGSQLYDTALSPYGNVATGSTGCLFFNTVPSDRSSQGYESDPLVNNEWTWSYPYETKYKPEKRILRTTPRLGLNQIDLTADWSLQYSGTASDWLVTVDNLSEKIVNPIELKNFLPILPGHMDGSELKACGGRNALRGVYNGGSLFSTPTIYGIDSGLDEKIGVSFLIPVDVDLSKKTDHYFLNSYPSVIDPGPEYLTGSMSTDDSVKFFFGFGDLNNMTYSQFNKSLSDSHYVEDFERTGDYTFYFWGNTATADDPDTTLSTPTTDRKLSLTTEGSNATIALTTSVELGPVGWTSIGMSTADYWITDLNIPNSSEIPAGTWNFRINTSASAAGYIKWRAIIYSWDGAALSTLGTSSESSFVGTSDAEMSFDWTISSPISLSSSDRIAVMLQAYIPLGVFTINLKTAVDYGSGDVFSRVLTNIPQDPNTFPLKKADEVDSYNDGVLQLDWSSSPTFIFSYRNWLYNYTDGTETISGDLYNYIAKNGAVPSPNGIYWLADGTNDFALSAVAASGNPRSYATCCVDITSSLPWSLKYDRAFIGNSGNYLKVYFSGIPGMPSGDLPGGPFDETLLLEYVTPSTGSPFYSVMSTYDSSLTNGGSSSDPYVFGPGTWRLVFISDFRYASGRAASAIDNIEITTYEISGDPDGPKIGGNNYPKFRKLMVDNRSNETKSGTAVEIEATKGVYESYVFGVSPVIRGWKYGLISGLPVNSKAVYRRGKYGQLRDMLEQRQYTKFINVKDSPIEGDATTKVGFDKDVSSRLTRLSRFSQVGPAVAEVNFFKQRYKKDERGIGYIYSEKVDPLLTTSQNLSSEVTSSIPYVDGVARHRQEDSFSIIADTSLVSLSLDPNGMTVL